jgi:3-deoxy-manno-octulosonate cytidylyltransferase (CMP-KDO synthetase)
MLIYGIIPARYGSTRFPGKPLALICGKAMIQHVYERSVLCRRLDKVLVATDDRRIRDAVESFGGTCILTRSDHPSGTDRLAEAADVLGLGDEDIVVNVQGDEPLLEPAMIESLIEAIVSPPRVEMATLAVSSSSSDDFADPNVAKVAVDANGTALYFSRSPIPFPRESEEPLHFLKHLGFYAYSRKFLAQFTGLPHGKLERIEKLEQLRALEHGYAIRVALSSFDSVSVDTPEDLQRVSRLMTPGCPRSGE